MLFIRSCFPVTAYGGHCYAQVVVTNYLYTFLFDGLVTDDLDDLLRPFETDELFSLTRHWIDVKFEYFLHFSRKDFLNYLDNLRHDQKHHQKSVEKIISIFSFFKITKRNVSKWAGASKSNESNWWMMWLPCSLNEGIFKGIQSQELEAAAAAVAVAAAALLNQVLSKGASDMERREADKEIERKIRDDKKGLWWNFFVLRGSLRSRVCARWDIFWSNLHESTCSVFFSSACLCLCRRRRQERERERKNKSTT